jgi:uncharacterized membrane protein (UPF0127 family)
MKQRIVNTRTGEVVADRAILADNPFTRMRGLLARRSLPAGEAIILKPASSIHTMFMLFSIDVVFLDRSDVVLKVVPNLSTFRFSAARGGHTVIEMAGKALADFDLEVGDRLTFEAISAQGLRTSDREPGSSS